MNSADRLETIIQAGNYSQSEIHDISRLLVLIRDTEQYWVEERCERCLQAFIARKRLGNPVSIKKMFEEFQIPPITASQITEGP